MMHKRPGGAWVESGQNVIVFSADLECEEGPQEVEAGERKEGFPKSERPFSQHLVRALAGLGNCSRKFDVDPVCVDSPP
jgi:hypothetical protein